MNSQFAQSRNLPQNHWNKVNFTKVLPTSPKPKEDQMKIHIKNMVCIRCKMVVKSNLEKIGIKYKSVLMGEVDLQDAMTDLQKEQLRIELLKSGLELMDDKKGILIEKIKAVVIEMVHYSEELPRVNFSTYLSEKLNYDYTYLANIFSEVVGTNIEHYLILHKIERVKELLVYDELSLTEIAYAMHYSSVAHLSNQFKKITGLTTTHFKLLKNQRKATLEDV